MQTVSSSIVKYGDPLTDNLLQVDCTLLVATGAPCPESVTAPSATALNNRAVSKVFATAFYGNIWAPGEWHVPYINVTNEFALRRLFTFQDSPYIFNLTDESHTLKETLVDMFSNMTIGLMAFRTENVTVQSLAWDGTIVWKYDRHTLILIYGIAFALVSLVSLYGMACLWKNQGAIDPTFGTFLLTVTRMDHLHKHFKTIPEMDEIERTKLQFSSKREAFILHAK
ncbi:hypothetical protein FRC17_009573 [Serendipita sp. 399]|nr:hypothetical protein FRC17_009573 [Serendipita sp. 399]